MPISIIADQAAEIPEALRPLAKEVDGKFTLTPPDGWGIDNVAAVRGKQTKLEQDLKRRDDRLKGFSKDDAGNIYEPDEFKAIVDEYRALKDAQGKAPNAEDLRKQVVGEVEGRYKRQLTEAEKRAADLDKRAADLDRELDNTTLDSVINSLVAEMRPKEGKGDVVRLLLRDKLGIDKSNGRQVRVRTPDGKDWMPGAGPEGFALPKDYALNVLRAAQADMFQGDGASGAGASSTNGARRSRFTFKRDDLNGKVAEFTAMQARAAAEGQKVEIVD